VFTGYTINLPTTYIVIHLQKYWLLQTWNYMTLPCEASVKYIFSWRILICRFEHPCIKALTIKPIYKQMLSRCTRNSGAEFEKWVALCNHFPSFLSSSHAPSGYNLISTKIKKRKILLNGKYITPAICSSYIYPTRKDVRKCKGQRDNAETIIVICLQIHELVQRYDARSLLTWEERVKRLTNLLVLGYGTCNYHNKGINMR
jgi:hypothetical protein